MMLKLFNPLAVVRLLTLYAGGPSSGESSTTVSNNYSPAEQAARDKLLQTAGTTFTSQQPSWASLINPASKPVGPSAGTTRGQDWVTQAAGGQMQNVVNKAADANTFGTSGAVLDPGNNPALQQVLNSATRRIGETYTDPGGVFSKIRTNSMLNNSTGSGTREGVAMGIAGRNYLNTVGDVTGKITSDAYGQGLDYMKNAMNQAPQIAALTTAPGQTVAAVGQQQEQYAQQQADAAASDKLWQLQAPWMGMSPYASIINGMQNPSTKTDATTKVADKNPLAPVGAGMTVVSALPAILKFLGIEP